ncbi:MAG: winged helix-turn-helix domain-containing protein [Pseudomonadota bacterium]
MDLEHRKRKRIRIDDLVLDPDLVQVFRGEDQLDLPKLSYRLLLTLTEAAPRVLSQDEIMEAVWPGKIVSPETLTQRVKLLREALGDDAQTPRYISVVRGEGYRMLADVSHEDEVSEKGYEGDGGVLSELKRRRVLQAALVYAAVAWSITEVLSFFFDALPIFPQGSKAFAAILFVVGFPVAMFLAWRFDLGRDGLVRTKPSSKEGQLTIAFAFVLLVGATGGLFYLIYPKVVVTQPEEIIVESDGPADNSLVVLNFRLVSDTPDDEPLSQGLSDQLRAQLSRTRNINVAARVSSMAMTEQVGLTAFDIREKIRVRYIVDGTWNKGVDGAMISVELIDSAHGGSIWSNTYNSADTPLQTIQQDIGLSVVKEILPDVATLFDNPGSTTDVLSAYEFLHKGNYIFDQVKALQELDEELLNQAISNYRQATIGDPNYTLAHVRLADALLYGRRIDEARESILNALDIDDSLSDALSTQGLLYYTIGAIEEAKESYKKAIEQNQNDPDVRARYAYLIWHEGRIEDTGALFRRALNLDRASIVRYGDYGNFLGWSGHRAELQTLIEEIKSFAPVDIDVGATNPIPRYLLLARLYELSGQVDRGIAWALRAHEASPDEHLIASQAAELYAVLGDFDTALEYETLHGDDPGPGLLYFMRNYGALVDEAEFAMIDHPEDSKLRYLLAFGHHANGNHGEALRVLRQAGLPQKALRLREAQDMEALVTFADATHKAGDQVEAERYAEIIADFMQVHIDTGSKDWWPYAYQACAFALLGEDSERVLEKLESVQDSARIPWLPFLRDAPCFRSYTTDPRYNTVLRGLEARQRNILAQVRETVNDLNKTWE